MLPAPAAGSATGREVHLRPPRPLSESQQTRQEVSAQTWSVSAADLAQYKETVTAVCTSLQAHHDPAEPGDARKPAKNASVLSVYKGLAALR